MNEHLLRTLMHEYGWKCNRWGISCVTSGSLVGCRLCRLPIGLMMGWCLSGILCYRLYHGSIRILLFFLLIRQMSYISFFCPGLFILRFYKFNITIQFLLTLYFHLVLMEYMELFHFYSHESIYSDHLVFLQYKQGDLLVNFEIFIQFKWRKFFDFKLTLIR